MRSVETVLFLVVVATLVATSARRLRVPAPSLLVVAGVVVGLLPGVPEIRVTPDVVSLVVLPPLLYAAGEEMSWRDLRRVWRPVTVLAVGLVLASAAAVGAVASLVAPLPTSMAFVLGTVLASTDPVAVSALGRRLSLPPKVQVLVQAESLFNDATSLVLFRVAVAVAVAGGAVSWGHAGGQFLVLAGGGLVIGGLVAGGLLLIRRRTQDPVLETVIALVTPYTAYVLAEAVHTSGVTAVVVASVLLGAQHARLTTAHIRLQVGAVYQTVIFLLESVVFGLIGLQLPWLIRTLEGSDRNWPWQALAVTGTLIAVRVLWVFPLSVVAQLRRGARRPAWQVPAVVSWAGARGVVPLAAALSIPLTTDGGTPLPQRNLVLVLATAVIVTTLVVQGFTLAPLVWLAGVVTKPDETRNEETSARLHLARASLAHLDQLSDLEAVPDVVVQRLRRNLTARVDRTRARLNGSPPTDSTASAYRRLRRDLIAVETAALNQLYDGGEVNDAVRRRIQRMLDLEDAGLGDDA
ncbi:Na+/H+ antiporter [Solihabitans fulvus]|uniref:Na+/H+ antiporter n=1 Tax=Solihabitans fulvus TaxID=1892852 RepID=A0A5B2XEI5_9PSEU|nr:Na+/H+ antiporter [Solihabitans fulvus]KAA2261469.1 Na+/H+ antiporter [Solihabitans fulvus]